MNELPETVFGHWLHAFEEDAGDVRVYRAADYPFPPARGRRGFEIAPDGTFTAWEIAPTDGWSRVPGRWELAGPGQIRVTFADDRRPVRVLHVVSAEAGRLCVREGAG